MSAVVTPFDTLGLGLGPLAAAATYDLSGLYEIINVTFIGAFAIAALLMLLAK